MALYAGNDDGGKGAARQRDGGGAFFSKPFFWSDCNDDAEQAGLRSSGDEAGGGETRTRAHAYLYTGLQSADTYMPALLLLKSARVDDRHSLAQVCARRVAPRRSVVTRGVQELLVYAAHVAQRLALVVGSDEQTVQALLGELSQPPRFLADYADGSMAKEAATMRQVAVVCFFARRSQHVVASSLSRLILALEYRSRDFFRVAEQ